MFRLIGRIISCNTWSNTGIQTCIFHAW